MSFSATIRQTVSEGNFSISYNDTVSVDKSQKLQKTVLDAATDEEFEFAIDSANVQVISIQSSVNMTLKTNSSGAPQETFTLIANIPVTWQTVQPAIIAGDVTSVFATNASGSDGVLKIFAGT